QMFLLATLYEAEMDWPKARAYLVGLMSTHAKHEKYYDYLAAFVGKLLLHGDVEGAEGWLDSLRELNPQAFPTVDCVVRYHAKRGTVNEILGPIKNYLESKDPKLSDPPKVRLALA